MDAARLACATSDLICICSLLLKLLSSCTCCRMNLTLVALDQPGGCRPKSSLRCNKGNLICNNAAPSPDSVQAHTPVMQLSAYGQWHMQSREVCEACERQLHAGVCINHAALDA